MRMIQQNERNIQLSEEPSDEVATTTCYMCACRCGIKVHLKNGKLRYIEGNENHPVNKGVICAKGSAGIMQQNSPARLRKPLLRVGERGSKNFKEIEWSEALDIATKWLQDARERNPRHLAFFTGRDQSQSLTGWWAMQYGTPNYAAHGGFCSVNMAAAGLYTFGGSFWEFGETDWPHTKYFLLFGVAEDHASNPLKIQLGQLKKRGVKFVSVNPVRTGYSAIADEWLGIRPGTDGLFIGALIHELIKAGKVDFDYLQRYANAAWLVIQDDASKQDGLFARDPSGNILIYDETTNAAVPANQANIKPRLLGEVKLSSGQTATPVFHLLAKRFLEPEYAPENAAEVTGIDAETIKRIAAELAHTAFEQEVRLDIPWTDSNGNHHAQTVGRPVGMHAMRGISAHSNGFHTCRMIHILQILLGSIDCPGGFRYKPPYPKHAPPHLKPCRQESSPCEPLPGPHLGFPESPDDILINADGSPMRIDKAFSWEAPLAAHGLMHAVIANAARHDPYPIDTLFLYMANMAWNSSMDITATLEHLTAKDSNGKYKIPHIIYVDAFDSETVAYADLVLPDTTYLERWDCISMLDRPISEPDAAADAIRRPVLDAVRSGRDVRPFQDVLIELGARLQLPGFVKKDGTPRYPGGYADYIVNHERAPGIGPLSGWRGTNGDEFGVGDANPRQLDRYIENDCFHLFPLPQSQRYYRHANRDYLQWAAYMRYREDASPTIFQLYLEPVQKFRLAACGKREPVPPASERERIHRYFDPLPFWHAPLSWSAEADDCFHAISQRPMAMYHSWGSQNPWLRQIHTRNFLYIHTNKAAALDLEDGDVVYLYNIDQKQTRIKARIRTTGGTNPDTLWTWNAVAKRSGAWSLAKDSPEARNGFLLNHLIAETLSSSESRYSNSDPVTGQAAWYDLRVRIEKAPAHEQHGDLQEPRLEDLGEADFLPPAPSNLCYGKDFTGKP